MLDDFKNSITTLSEENFIKLLAVLEEFPVVIAGGFVNTLKSKHVFKIPYLKDIDIFYVKELAYKNRSCYLG